MERRAEGSSAGSLWAIGRGLDFILATCGKFWNVLSLGMTGSGLHFKMTPWPLCGKTGGGRSLSRKINTCCHTQGQASPITEEDMWE